ncbi:MAG: hypothetical protein JW822_12405 [Spirochaetales bacterium]|nr:hypothetical protein [Spirochaetales bacterium]
MKKLLIFLLPLLFMLSCADMLTTYTDGGEIEFPDNRGAVRVSLPGQQNRAATQEDVESYDVALVGIDIVFESSQIGLPGETITFENLTPGNYTVTVDAYDAPDPAAAESNRIFTGSADALVVAGQVTTVTIQLEYVEGDIEIEIIFPDEPTEPPVGEELLDQVQDQIKDISAMVYYETGQVFTAGMTGELTKIELHLGYNASSPGLNPEVWLVVRDGAGFTGTELGTSEYVILESPGPGWITFEFDDVSVSAGSQYTIEIVSEGDVEINGYDWYDEEDIYPDGYALWTGYEQAWDFTFRTYVYQ